MKPWRPSSIAIWISLLAVLHASAVVPLVHVLEHAHAQEEDGCQEHCEHGGISVECAGCDDPEHGHDDHESGYCVLCQVSKATWLASVASRPRVDLELVFDERPSSGRASQHTADPCLRLRAPPVTIAY